MDEASFTATQASLSQELEDGIRVKFDIDWKQTLYQDLLKPLYSGIAARLKIVARYRRGNIPQGVREQASYWATTYTTKSSANSADDYTRASDALTTSKQTLFCLDFSHSLLSNYIRGDGQAPSSGHSLSFAQKSRPNVNRGFIQIKRPY